jgi:hypothetical protein
VHGEAELRGGADEKAKLDWWILSRFVSPRCAGSVECNCLRFHGLTPEVTTFRRAARATNCVANGYGESPQRHYALAGGVPTVRSRSASGDLPWKRERTSRRKKVGVVGNVRIADDAPRRNVSIVSVTLSST